VQLFYNPDIRRLTDDFVLEKDESRHLVRVLRKTNGDLVDFTDGRGGHYVCELTDANDKRARLSVQEKHQHEPRVHSFHLAIAPTKKMDRLEWCIEKAVEIGVETITPIITENSERRHLRLDRLERIAISAMKQSLKFHATDIQEVMTLKQLMTSVKCEHKFIAHKSEDLPAGRQGFPGSPLVSREINGDVLVLIGPEGDFSPTELKAIMAADYECVTLGNSRLRTETAGVVASTQVAQLIEKL
jgi:16S rRNA (uracil1498-N3)-methyltransferase